MKCPYCNGDVELKDSSVLYGKSYGLVYVCSNFPDCDAYVGVHDKTTKPKGTLANYELRKLRIKCHDKFDAFWNNKRWSRKQAYGWLKNIMGLNKDLAHIGMFNESQCKELLNKLN